MVILQVVLYWNNLFENWCVLIKGQRLIQKQAQGKGQGKGKGLGQVQPS